MKFEVDACGKWILAGEHAVIRGVPALVFPLSSRTMELSYESSEKPLTLELVGQHGPELEPLFWAVLQRGCDLMEKPRAEMKGHVQIRSSIPIGAGLGASAAFCVAMTKWFSQAGWLKVTDLAEFARTLENLFHGESSGVDIAVAITGQGLHFERKGINVPVVPKWQPKWFISYTGQRGITADAVAKVKELLAKDPEKGQMLDVRMGQAVATCEAALQQDAEQGFLSLKTGIDQALTCFQDWGLAGGAVADHLGLLTAAGAVAVKPTGSGGGGYVLSLWSNDPPQNLRDQLIPC